MAIDITGQKFNKLTAITFSHYMEYVRSGRTTMKKVPYWSFKCDCGEVVVRSAESVKAGSQKSCGCHRKETSKEKATTHGKSDQSKNRLYRIWAQMKRRCNLPSVEAYPRYGGRGISVCEEWSNSFEVFEAWALANGYEEHLTIDREDNDGDYTPDNCRWVTRRIQANNRRSNRSVMFDGKIITIAELARITGVEPSTLTQRLEAGFTVTEAVNHEKWKRRT